MSLTTALRNRFAELQSTDITDQNIRYLYYEIIFASILGGIISFNSVFAIR
jgi:hypothetical protein